MLTLSEIWDAEEGSNAVKRCRFPLTDDLPHYFCGETTDGRSYCPAHDAKCHMGPGKPWQGLAGMIEATEQSIVKMTPREDVQPDLDAALASAATVFDKPGGLMGRT